MSTPSLDHEAAPAEENDFFTDPEGMSTSGLFSGQLPLSEALQQLRLKLLDLTRRNRLINFKHSAGKSLQFVSTSMNAVFTRLIDDVSNRVDLIPLPEPQRAQWIERNGRLTRPEPKTYAAEIGLDPSFDLFRRSTQALTNERSGAKAWTLHYAEDLGRNCRKLERDARLAIEESGANTLYLVFGFLEYKESPDSDRSLLAPLVSLPVLLSHTNHVPHATYHLHFTGEELEPNLSLFEKLQRDHGLMLPVFDPDEETSLEHYLDKVSDTIHKLPGWRVRRMMTLTLLSFTNMLLVRDLDPENWPIVNENSELLSHPIVRQVFQGRPDDASTSTRDEDHPIDQPSHEEIPLIYDADSSQHSALLDVLRGKNRVIEGPPGTGKSQTITNLIAAAIQSGKKVLFVAEKLAALEVVKSRLVHANLGAFVLELHSDKANRSQVLNEMRERLAVRPKHVLDLYDKLETLERERGELRIYAELVNAKVGNQLDLTLHQVMWRSERHRLKCGEAYQMAQPVTYPAAKSTDPTRLDSLRTLVRDLAVAIEPIGSYGPKHPLWGFFPSEFKPEDDIPAQQLLSRSAQDFQQFEEALHELNDFLGTTEAPLDAQAVKRLSSALHDLTPPEGIQMAFDYLPALFNEQDRFGERSLAIINRLDGEAQHVRAHERKASAYLIDQSPATESRALESAYLLRHLQALGLDDSQLGQLHDTRTRLQVARDTAATALMRIERASQSFPVQFAMSDIAAAGLSGLFTSVDATPVDLLHLRSTALQGPDVVKVLSHSRNRLKEIQQSRQELEERLYLDALPSKEELTRAIRVLRTGPTWYRFLQSDWRRAVSLHKQLQRERRASTFHERLTDLESLRAMSVATEEWMSDVELRAVLGERFIGESTKLDEFDVLARWMAAMDSALLSIGADSSIDLVEISRSHLQGMKSAADEIRLGIAGLDQLRTALEQLSYRADEAIKVNLCPDEWSARLSSADEKILLFQKAEELLASHVKPGITAAQGLDAVVSSRKAFQQDQSLAADPDGIALLGRNFQGKNTDFQALLATHAYGRTIKGTRLTSEFEQRLLSPDCVSNHQALVIQLQKIQRGWASIDSFEAAMSEFGPFDLSAWAGSDERSAGVYVERLSEKTSNAAASAAALMDWTRYVHARMAAVNSGLEGFAKLLESGAIPRKLLEHAFLYRFYAAIALDVFGTKPELRQFNGMLHTQLRHRFADLDKEIIALRGHVVALQCKVRSRPPRGTYSARVNEKTEMELLNHLVTQKRPRVTVRRMLQRAGIAMQELMPCFMMGPKAVAQFLTPGYLKFDLVVMDEASQLRPEQAIGAIARGNQLVVVGDPKQLPPTSFFERMNAIDDDDGTEATVTSEAESILDVCISHFQPVRTLRWHYRSRHESLIAFSNHHFYRNKLVVFPSPFPKSKALGLRYQYVMDGVYESHRNHPEARRVVDAVVAHILHRPEDSLGIVTLNLTQRDLIAELLDDHLRTVPQAEDFRRRWDKDGMGLFVKNLENVQGDERDCIMISTTFGKPKGIAVVRQNFGPISRSGGWRRLNVLFTRARKSVVVFSSMRPEDIVVDGRTPEGTRALRNYLEYARSGHLPIEISTGLPPDSDFEIAVAEVLRARGFEVEPQLGVSGYRIDIAVKHPQHKSGYLAAIECDGASYHSGTSVRDRDRIRQEVLEGLGWQGRIWRIWSTDWFRNPIGETERLLSFLHSLQMESNATDESFYTAPDEIEEIRIGLSPSVPSDSESIVDQEPDGEETILITDEDEHEVEVGDLVIYAPEDALENCTSVRISRAQTNLDLGIVAQSTPLAAALLGSTVGDTVVLRVPGRPSQSLVIQEIHRTPEVVKPAGDS